MGGKNKKTTQTSTYGYQTPPSTPDIEAARSFTPQANPAIGYAFARAKNALRNTFTNPLGADTPAAVKDAMLYQGEQDLAQQEAQALREEGDDLNRQEYAKRIALAELTRPNLVQTGGTTVAPGGGIGSGLLGAAQVAASF